jgi:hypothetical protein
MGSRCARARAMRARVELQLHQGAGIRQYRELGAFVRYCVSRIERELGEIEHWSVTIAPAGGKFTSVVAVQDAGDAIESTGTGMDGPLAAWEALCRLEQRLREARACRTAEAALAATVTAGRHLALVNGSGAR